MAVPSSESVTLLISLTDSGSVTIFYGWIFLNMILTYSTASLAEICSACPTSGDVCFWSTMLVYDKRGPLTSCITGWLGLFGN